MGNVVGFGVTGLIYGLMSSFELGFLYTSFGICLVQAIIGPMLEPHPLTRNEETIRGSVERVSV